ncbi:MAG: hypothetical protein GX639_00795 [Fibrobacter sp.]|nr:hypothetical protein [Fibrobacter sp.]
MDKLRIPLFIIAAILLIIAFGLEIGSNRLVTILASAFDVDAFQKAKDAGGVTPGIAIGVMSLFDGLVLFSVLLIGASLIIPDSIQGRIQGIITLIVSIIVIISGIVLLISSFVQLVLMISLLFAPIFGTIAYFAIYADFPSNSAKTILGLILLFKIGFAIFLLFAHQRFLQNTSLVILILLSMVLGLLVSLLHGIVPGFLVSITDALGGIIVAIVAIVFAVLYLINSVVSIVKAVA